MPRRPRLILPDIPLHLIQRGNNRQVDQIRQATNGNFALGCERFADEITKALGQRAARGKPGRPVRMSEGKTRVYSMGIMPKD